MGKYAEKLRKRFNPKPTKPYTLPEMVEFNVDENPYFSKGFTENENFEIGPEEHQAIIDVLIEQRDSANTKNAFLQTRIKTLLNIIEKLQIKISSDTKS